MSLLGEFWDFLKIRKKFWLAPILIVLVILVGSLSFWQLLHRLRRTVHLDTLLLGANIHQEADKMSPDKRILGFLKNSEEVLVGSDIDRAGDIVGVYNSGGCFAGCGSVNLYAVLEAVTRATEGNCSPLP